MIIDRPIPATRNGLGNVIRGWPRWMFPKACKKHKLCSSWRVEKAYAVGIAKWDADFYTCLSFVIAPHNMLVSSGFSLFIVAMVSHLQLCQRAYVPVVDWGFWDTPILFLCNATSVPSRTGRTKVALVELPPVNMLDFFLCTPFPLRILARSCVVPRSNFHPPKALNLIDLIEGDNWPSHTCHTKRTWKCDPRLTKMDVS